MRFTIEIEDSYIEEGDLNAALKIEIINSITHKIRSEIKEKAEKQIEMETKMLVEKHLYVEITKNLKSALENGQIKSKVKQGEMVSFETYISECIAEVSGWNSLQEHVKKIGKDISDKMKKELDMQMATQIVIKMAENNLLKEEMAQMLLQNNNVNP